MFLNAIMLTGLSAAVLPIVLHLLNRARYRRVEWGAMMFLEDAAARRFDRSKLAQYLLLAMRVLAIALLALALARPITRRAFGPADAQRLAAVIVIDASPSMGHPEQSVTRLDLARRAALGILGELRRGDQVGLVTLGQSRDRDLPLTTDLQDIASRLASVQTTGGASDLADGVRRADALLSLAGEVPREIYLIGDRQQSAWRNLEQLSENLRQNARIVAIPVGSTEDANAWIESVALAQAPAIAGIPAEIEIRVRNGGSIARSDLPVTITLDDKELDRTRVFIAPGAVETVRRRVTLPKPGSALLAVSIGAAGMPADDSTQLAIDVIEPIRVLVITGESPQEAERTSNPDYSGEADYLRLALMPFQLTGQPGADAFNLRVESEQKWPELDARKDQIVVLADVATLDARKIRALEQFVFSGGGLLLAPGSRTDPKQWNQWLWRDGQGVAPASIESIRSAGDDIVNLVGISTTHEIFSFFSGRPDPLPPVSVARWARFAPGASGAVLASLQSGDALLLQHAFGKGRVIASAIPIDADWSDFCLSNLYLPTMQSIGRYLASAAAQRNLAPGTAIETTIDSPKERVATVRRPDGRADRVPLSLGGGSGTLIYPDTDLPGSYIIQSPGVAQIVFVVRGGNEESELNLLDDDKLSAIAGASGINLVLTPNLAGAAGQSRRSTELSLILIALALVVLGIELLLAQQSLPPIEGAPT